jgi:hypothetical protein
MLFTTHNPTVLRGYTHNVLSYSPFTVEFICLTTGRTAIERYAVVLTKKEIKAEYEYIVFKSN